MGSFQDYHKDTKPGLGLYLTGIGSQYPPYLWGPEKLEEIAARYHDTRNQSILKLLQMNRNTGNQTRSSILTLDEALGTESVLPSIVDLDGLFRVEGVNLAVGACEKALGEWGGRKKEITHTVAVTCTNQGNPGYDLLVCRQLGLSSEVDGTLIHGVGCAGGLSILRTAAQIALGATARGKPARIIAFACELCTPTARGELVAVEATPPKEVGPAGALFSDGAAAFVLCNKLGLEPSSDPLFELLTWESVLLPGTIEHMSYVSGPYGNRTFLSRSVSGFAQQAAKQLYDELVQNDVACLRLTSEGNPDWALHPGGQAVIDGIQESMHLSDHQLRATKEIYKTRSNSSSSTVLIVLDRLQAMGPVADHVVACSFGPGLTVEMAVLERYQKSPVAFLHTSV